MKKRNYLILSIIISIILECILTYNDIKLFYSSLITLQSFTLLMIIGTTIDLKSNFFKD